jgi:hypothetical protein
MFKVYAYRIILLPIMSLIANVGFLVKYWNKRHAVREDLREIIGRIETFNDVEDLARDKVFRYVPDPPIGPRLTWNYVPWSLAVIVARGGGDCSVLARLFKRIMVRVGIRVNLYMIMDGDRIETTHVIGVYKIPGLAIDQIRIFNAGSIVISHGVTVEQAIDRFRTESLVILGKYEDLRVYKWF